MLDNKSLINIVDDYRIFILVIISIIFITISQINDNNRDVKRYYIENDYSYCYHQNNNGTLFPGYLLKKYDSASLYTSYYVRNYDTMTEFPLNIPVTVLPINTRIVTKSILDPLIVKVECYIKKRGEVRFMKGYMYKKLVHDIPGDYKRDTTLDDIGYIPF